MMSKGGPFRMPCGPRCKLDINIFITLSIRNNFFSLILKRRIRGVSEIFKRKCSYALQWLKISTAKSNKFEVWCFFCRQSLMPYFLVILETIFCVRYDTFDSTYFEHIRKFRRFIRRINIYKNKACFRSCELLRNNIRCQWYLNKLRIIYFTRPEFRSIRYGLVTKFRSGHRVLDQPLKKRPLYHSLISQNQQKLKKFQMLKIWSILDPEFFPLSAVVP